MSKNPPPYDWKAEAARYSHTERRKKVSFADYFVARKFAGQKITDMRQARLMATPANRQRNSLPDAVKQRGDVLARKAHRFLTLATDYNERALWAKRFEADTRPYHVRLAAACPVKPTRQSPCLPFESGRNTLPGMEKFAP